MPAVDAVPRPGSRTFCGATRLLSFCVILSFAEIEQLPHKTMFETNRITWTRFGVLGFLSSLPVQTVQLAFLAVLQSSRRVHPVRSLIRWNSSKAAILSSTWDARLLLSCISWLLWYLKRQLFLFNMILKHPNYLQNTSGPKHTIVIIYNIFEQTLYLRLYTIVICHVIFSVFVVVFASSALWRSKVRRCCSSCRWRCSRCTAWIFSGGLEPVD